MKLLLSRPQPVRLASVQAPRLRRLTVARLQGVGAPQADPEEEGEEEDVEENVTASAVAAEEVEEYEEVIEEVADATPAPAPAPIASKKAAASQAVVSPPQGGNQLTVEVSQQAIRVGVGMVATFLGATFLVAVYRAFAKFKSAPEVRKRQVNKNLKVVQMLAEYLPAKRTELTPNAARAIASKTGFSRDLVFRKYVWFALRERKFDPDLINDLLQLKAALGLSEVEVARALKERCERIAKKYGPILVQTEGLTAKGVEKKAALRAFFSKLLFLTEQVETLVTPEAVKEAEFDILKIFSCANRDAEKLRIVSLYDMDLSRVEELAMTKTDGDSEEQDRAEGQGPTQADINKPQQ